MSKTENGVLMAPWESCVGCYRGDTTTVVLAKGEAEFVIAFLMTVSGMSESEATLVVQDMAGSPSGTVPVGRITTAVRLCTTCAKERGVAAEALHEESVARSGAPVAGYAQPATPG